MNNEKVGIVIDSTPEKTEQLKKRWSNVKNLSNVGSGIFATGFIGSVLSPFDIEGPTVEIITAAGTLTCYVLGKIAENKLKELDEQSTLKDLSDDNDLSR